MRNIGIRAKLILSIGALALGYLIFWGLIQWTGVSMQHHLRRASESLFPAALASQEAEAGFQKLTKDYKDAVLMQDSNALTLAERMLKRFWRSCRSFATVPPRARSCNSK